MHIYRHTHKYTLPKKIIRRCKRASIQLHMDIKNGMIVGPLCHRSSDKYIVHKCHWEYLNVVFDFLFTHSTSLFTLSCLSPSPPISLDTACSGRQRIGITKIMATSSNRFTTRTEAVSGILRAVHRCIEVVVCGRRLAYHCAPYTKIKTRSKIIAALNLDLHS